MTFYVSVNVPSSILALVGFKLYSKKFEFQNFN